MFCGILQNGILKLVPIWLPVQPLYKSLWSHVSISSHENKSILSLKIFLIENECRTPHFLSKTFFMIKWTWAFLFSCDYIFCFAH